MRTRRQTSRCRRSDHLPSAPPRQVMLAARLRRIRSALGPDFNQTSFPSQEQVVECDLNSSAGPPTIPPRQANRHRGAERICDHPPGSRYRTEAPSITRGRHTRFQPDPKTHPAPCDESSSGNLVPSPIHGLHHLTPSSWMGGSPWHTGQRLRRRISPCSSKSARICSQISMYRSWSLMPAGRPPLVMMPPTAAADRRACHRPVRRRRRSGVPRDTGVAGSPWCGSSREPTVMHQLWSRSYIEGVVSIRRAIAYVSVSSWFGVETVGACCARRSATSTPR